ncbi:hypothetical protein TH25_08635 [Thalassospira profundimaris]|uniref:Methyltransferase type 11 domain-containing protein n=1 Tax=Thalassospira profundimaris TaxID=502049 RepID=A0A367XDK8_9PROT|nr:methyltransferase domain-containing protein [Thalassospira profundimaris]RCK51728.1 hypothetical protein TH25_08635 [Thalassospira profundimaris]
MMNQDAGNPIWQDLSSDWLNWADRLAPQADKINRHLIDALELHGMADRVAQRCHNGLCVLDLASGVGEPAFGLAALLSSAFSDMPESAKGKPFPSGRVIASDIAPSMCAGLAGRAARAEIANLDVVAANMQSLPFADAMFHGVSCRFGIMFCQNPDQALRETRRVLAPGGRAAFMVWGPMAENPLFGAMDAIFKQVLGTGFEAAGLDLFGFSSAENSVARLINAGFDDVSLVTHTPCGRIPAAAPFWRPQMQMLFGAALRNATSGQGREIDDLMRASLSQHIEDTYFRVPMCFHVLSGRREMAV